LQAQFAAAGDEALALPQQMATVGELIAWCRVCLRVPLRLVVAELDDHVGLAVCTDGWKLPKRHLAPPQFQGCNATVNDRATGAVAGVASMRSAVLPMRRQAMKREMTAPVVAAF